MRVTVVVIGTASLAALVGDATAGTSARCKHVPSPELVDDALVALNARLEQLQPAAVVVDDDVDDRVVEHLIKRIVAEERHRFLVVRTAPVSIDVEWTVVRRSEVVRGVRLLIADAEAIVVDLLARIGDARRPTAPMQLGCVVSVASSFVLVAIDEHSPDVTVAFVLPREGKLVVQGPAVAVPGRTGLFRVAAGDESVAQALMRFTLRRSESL
jgi:hypothetical protein